jgi:hypothetical protein
MPNDAERAVRAGLELIAAVTGLKTRAPLQTRVGIATGPVVVGDRIGSGEAQERGIVGETPNVAARLQGIAEPNTVVIAEGTRRLLGNLFELQGLGARDLKGVADRARTWAVLRPSTVESRFEALHATGLTALVGREEELELLLRRWARAKTGEGQVVLLSGEAGIGKSRLTAALMEHLATEPHTRLRYFCSPQHTDSALYPIIGQMERAAGLAHDDAMPANLDKLDALLAQTSTPFQDAALAARELGPRGGGRPLGCVQHIGSHPHSPGCCGRRPFIFTDLRISQTSMLKPSRLVVLMMQFWTYFRRFNQCHLNFMPLASALHAAVAFSRATLSALDIFAGSAGVGMNAMPLTSTVAIMPVINAVAKWYMVPSFEALVPYASSHPFDPPHCRRNRTNVAEAGCSQS